ncbi:LOW QUALITY PROTEIN: hypothetical protein ACHAWF_003734 [Thalassiosira exigua]
MFTHLLEIEIQRKKSRGDRAQTDDPSEKYSQKDETTSPTVMKENVFLTTTIDGCDVVTVDIAGAFLHTDVDPHDDTAHMTLRGTLAKLMLNPYDPHVANKTASGSQLTVTWHVDDLKISHKNPNVITKFIAYLNDIYLGVTVYRGHVHEYLGMTLDYSTPKEVHVSMTDYLIKMVKDFPEAIVSTAVTSAAEYLCNVSDD